MADRGTMDVLEEIHALCQDMAEIRTTCLNFHARLLDLQREAAEGLAQEPGNVILVHEFKQLLEKYRHCQNQPFHVRCILYDRVVRDVQDLHKQANKISSAPLWKLTWDATTKDELEGMMERAADPESLSREGYTQCMMEEALAVIKFETDGVDLGDSTRPILTQLVGTIERISDIRFPRRVPKWFVPGYDIKLGNEVASESFGTMHRAQWKDKDVVVHRLLEDPEAAFDTMARTTFERDVSACFRLKHEHLARVLKACHVSSPPFIVYELAQPDDLLTFIANSTSADVWRLLYETALGLRYLHRCGKLHGRLNVHNILVDAQGNAKISGYGLLKTRRSFPSQPSSTTCYRAPECRKGGGRETPASDVFSLAMCILHAVTQKLPFGDWDDASILEGACIPNRPRVDVMPEKAWALIEKMAQAVPAARCSLDEVIATLRVFAEEQDQDQVMEDEASQVVQEQLPTSVVLSVSATATSNTDPLQQASARDHDIGYDEEKIQDVTDLSFSFTPSYQANSETDTDSDSASPWRLDPDSTMDLTPAQRSDSDEFAPRTAHAVTSTQQMQSCATHPASVAEDGKLRQLVDELASASPSVERVAILKELYRSVQDHASYEQVGDAGYEIFAGIVRSKTSTWKESLYAFGLLDQSRRRWNRQLQGSEYLEAMVKLPDRATLHLLKQGISSGDRSTVVEACEMMSCVALVSSVECRDMVEPLIAMLMPDRRRAQDEYRPSLKTIAADTLGYFALNTSYREIIQAADGIKWLVELLACGSTDEKTKAVWGLACLTGSSMRGRNEALNDGRCLEFQDVSGDSIREAVFCAVSETREKELLAEIIAWNSDDRNGKLWVVALLGAVAGNNVHRYRIVCSGALQAIRDLVVRGNDEEKREAACALSVLSRSRKLTYTIVQAMTLPDARLTLPELLSSGTEMTAIWAALTVYRLAADLNVCKSLQSCVKPLVTMMESDGEPAQIYGAAAISQLARSEDVWGFLGIISAIQSSVRLLDSSNGTVKDWAVFAIANFAKTPATHELLAASDVISRLTALVTNGNEKQKTRAATALARLVYSKFTHAAIAGAIPPLVREANGSTSMLKTPALYTLSHIAPSHVGGVAMDEAITVMIHALCRGDRCQTEYAAFGLANFAEMANAVDAIVKSDVNNLIQALKKLVRERFPKPKKHALRLLSRLVQHVAIYRSTDMGSFVAILLAEARLPVRHGKADAFVVRALAMETLFYLTVNTSIHQDFKDVNIRAFKKVTASGDPSAKVWTALTVANLSLRTNEQAVVVDATTRAVIERCAVDGGIQEKTWAKKTLEQLNWSSDENR